MSALLQLAHLPTHCPHPLIPWPPCPSPIRLPALAVALRSHPDQQFVTFVLQRLTYGFRIGFARQRSPSLRSSGRSHPSVSACPQAISQYIRDECEAGRMVGPLPSTLEARVHCSPIGLVPKGRNTGRWRMIVDLSYPEARSVNDRIDPELCSLQYASIDEALRFILLLDHRTQLVKVDLKSAYRLVPVHPEDRHLLGICLQGNTFVDQALPFGLRSAPKLFTALADAIGWALVQRDIPLLIHYLDDFLFFIPPFDPRPQALLSAVLSALQALGVPVAQDKIEGPSTTITFLGIVIDTCRFELRLPGPKLVHIRQLVQAWHSRRSGRYKEFEFLLGHLSHAATVIREGRIFLRHLFSLVAVARSRRRHFIHLDAMARADLLWWSCFLHSWNGMSFIPQPHWLATHVYTDASGSFGCGGLMLPSDWFHLSWPPSWSTIDISVKELVPIIIATALWGRSWARSRVCFHTDNMAVVDILSKGSARDPLAHHLVRCLYFYSSLYAFQFVVMHVPGVFNVAADALSRNNLQLFSSLIPQGTHHVIPASVVNLLVQRRPDWGSRP